MPMPDGIGAVDLMIGFPSADARSHYDFLRAQTKDAESAEMEFPAEYMFKQVPNHLPEGADPIEITLGEMDRCGVAIGMIGNPYGELAERALRDHPDRFVASLEIDPNDITGAVRRVRRAKDEHDIKAVTSFPAGCNPQVPVSDRRYYPIFQTCIDLDIPVVLNAGVPGPRLPAACQDVMHFDQVCYDFPELRIVMRHGAEPWQELAAKLMLKWPGLHYMPSAFAPKYYQHPGRRQGDVRRLLPDGPQPAPHLRGDAQRAAEGRRVAQVPPRQRHEGLQARFGRWVRAT